MPSLLLAVFWNFVMFLGCLVVEAMVSRLLGLQLSGLGLLIFGLHLINVLEVHIMAYKAFKMKH